ncbi:conserved exported hypothetical protein [Verrucomicrobia bacterium]|nr:conserved exported hypothetical protein [Verrucomicrobiota bacterium]
MAILSLKVDFMLLRICLIAVILAGLAVCGVNVAVVKDKINALTEERNNENKGRLKAEGELASTRKELNQTTADLKKTKQDLADANEKEAKAESDLAAQTKRADKLTEDLKKTTDERNDAQANLAAYVATGYKSEEIVRMGKAYHDLQITYDEAKLVNKAQAQRIASLTNQLAIYTIANYVVPLPSSLKGKVLVTDPKWNFVVLNVGADQGVLDHGELLVNRDGRLVAKVKVSSVQKDRCVANVMPGWELGQVLEGDQVIPAYPAS